jgi:hypothetical protein
MVMVDGQLLISGGEHLIIDEESVLQKAVLWQDRITGK